MPEITLLESIRQGIDEMMAADARIFVFGEDVGRRGGVFRVTEGLVDKYGPMRVLDSPLADSQGTISSARPRGPVLSRIRRRTRPSSKRALPSAMGCGTRLCRLAFRRST